MHLIDPKPDGSPSDPNAHSEVIISVAGEKRTPLSRLGQPPGPQLLVHLIVFVLLTSDQWQNSQ